MSDSLLSFYEKELAFIQKSSGSFSKQHPAAASHLQISEDTVDDPLVAKLLSGFAFMNARIQQKLNDDFPELTDAMLDTLYPHYLRPIPSLAITQFSPAPEAVEKITVEKGIEIETPSFQGETCRFSTCYPVDIEPFYVHEASLMPRPFIAPGSNSIQGASSVLKLSLKGLSDDYDFSTALGNKIRFFLKGQLIHSYALYELLFTKSIKIVLAKGDTDPSPIVLNTDILSQVGLEKNEGLLPYPENSFIGYRLLTEFFTFPEKFLFFDLQNLSKYLPEDFGSQLNIYFYINESNEELEHQLEKSMFALGCTPVINLFEYAADPIPLTHNEYQYHVVPDARRPKSLEIYSIEQVVATNSQGAKVNFYPFYSANHRRDTQNNSAFWFPNRRTITEGEHYNEFAVETDISVVDLHFNPFHGSDKSLNIDLICSNRNLPKNLPSNKDNGYLRVVDGSFDSPIEFITPPTPAIRSPSKSKSYWKLISHLNLNHLSLGSQNGNCDHLKEVLRLYDFKDSASTRNLIEAIQKVSTNPVMAPIQIENTTALCRGTEVHITLDALMLSGTSPILFASILEKFFGLYCSINSFTKLVASLNNQERELKRWPPRAGEKSLV